MSRWREPILNHFDNGTTNGFTEGCNTKIKMLKRVPYGLRNVEVYWRKMLLGFVPSRSYFHTIRQRADYILTSLAARRMIVSQRNPIGGGKP